MEKEKKPLDIFKFKLQEVKAVKAKLIEQLERYERATKKLNDSLIEDEIFFTRYEEVGFNTTQRLERDAILMKNSLSESGSNITWIEEKFMRRD